MIKTTTASRCTTQYGKGCQPFPSSQPCCHRSFVTSVRASIVSPTRSWHLHTVPASDRWCQVYCPIAKPLSRCRRASILLSMVNSQTRVNPVVSSIQFLFGIISCPRQIVFLASPCLECNRLLLAAQKTAQPISTGTRFGSCAAYPFAKTFDEAHCEPLAAAGLTLRAWKIFTEGIMSMHLTVTFRSRFQSCLLI